MTVTRRSVVAVAVVMALVGCGAEQQDDAHLAPAFALSEAHVVSGEAELPVNLVFVADEDDPLWTRLSGVELNGGLDVTHYELIAGGATRWGTLGNLSIMAQVPAEAREATEVTVHLENATSASFPIGTWNIASTDGPGERLLEVAEYIAVYPDTDMMEFTATNVSGQDVIVTALDLGLTSLIVQNVTVNAQDLASGGVEVPAGADATFVLRLRAGSEHNFYMTSPIIALVGADGRELREILDPALLGLSDLTEAEIAVFAR